jgi:hypothetical protein
MGWANSAIFQQSMKNPMTASLAGTSAVTLPTGYSATGGLAADTIKCAAFNNTGTPNKADTIANIGYGAGQWVTGNEVTGTNWSAGGVAVGTTSYALDTGSSSFCFTVSGGQTSTATVTLAGFFGLLVYDNSISAGTVSKQGMCFNYFGGTQTVTAATFTIQWPTPASAADTAIFNISV